MSLRSLAASMAALALFACSTVGPETVEPAIEEVVEVTEAAPAADDASTLYLSTPEYFAETIGDKVYFDFDKSDLKPEAQAILRNQASWLRFNNVTKLRVEGHCDERGTREYNIALGSRRASAVKEFLISLGVPGQDITIISYGKERPVATCSAERCWRLNRRAVVVPWS